MGEATPKCLLPIDGVPMLLLAVWPFHRRPEVCAVVLVVPRGSEGDVAGEVAKWRISKVASIIAGGERRQDSVYAGLKAVPDDITHILVHDGARPLLSERLLSRVITALKRHPAVSTAVPVMDTLHTVAGGRLKPGPNREGLVRAQTPQGFARGMLENALRRGKDADRVMTDEAALVREMTGVEAVMVPGEPGNVKMTLPDDLRLNERQLRRRAGIIKSAGG